MMSSDTSISLRETGRTIGGAWSLPSSAQVGSVLLFAVVFFNESNFRNVDVENFSFDWQMALRLVVCMSCGIYGLFCMPQTSPYHFAFPGLLAVMFGAWALFTVPLAENFTYSLAACVSLWCVILGAPAIVINVGPRNVIKIIIAALLIYLAGSWITFFLVPELGRMVESDGNIRFGGLNHPNGTGRQCALLVGMLLMGGTMKIVRWPTCTLLIAFASWSIFLTDSRTAMCATAAAVVLVVLRNARADVKAFLIVAGLAVAALWLVLVAANVDTMFSGISRTGDSEEIYTLTGRTELWKFCAVKISESPLLGYGYGCSRFVIAGHEWVTHHAHNVLINIVLCTGIVGGSILAMMFAFQLIWMVRAPDLFADVVTVLILIGGIADVVMLSPVPDSHTLIWLIALAWRFMPEKQGTNYA